MAFGKWGVKKKHIHIQNKNTSRPLAESAALIVYYYYFIPRPRTFRFHRDHFIIICEVLNQYVTRDIPKLTIIKYYTIWNIYILIVTYVRIAFYSVFDMFFESKKYPVDKYSLIMRLSWQVHNIL